MNYARKRTEALRHMRSLQANPHDGEENVLRSPLTDDRELAIHYVPMGSTSTCGVENVQLIEESFGGTGTRSLDDVTCKACEAKRTARLRCMIGSLSDNPCPGTATHQAENWGYGPGSDELEICESHAREALSGGTRVINADGDDLELVDGEMVPK